MGMPSGWVPSVVNRSTRWYSQTVRFTASQLSVLLAITGCHHGGSGLVDTSDGGSDSGVPDAGVLDAGPDAGPFDAGIPDSGIADSGPVDSGMPDGGLVDAGHDAGPQCQPDASAAEFGPASILADIPVSVPYWFAVADFNHDEIEDLLVVGGYGGTSLFYGLADGGVAAGPFFPETAAAVYATAGDLNGDGWADFITTCEVTSDADPYLDIEINETDGSFAGTQLDTATLGPTTSVYQTSLADLDGDGRADIVACTSNGIVIYFDDGGAPSFGQPAWVDPWDGGTSESFSLTYFCDSLVVADLDGDGNADVASVSGYSPYPSEPIWTPTEEYLVIRLGIGDGGFSRTSRELIFTTPTVEAGALAATDVDGDGLVDLVWWNDLGIAVRLNRGGGVFGTEVDVGTSPPIDISTEPPTGWGGSLIVADFNGDGLPDVATTVAAACDNGAGSGAWLFLNDGCAGFALGSPLPLDPSTVIGSLTAWRPAGQPPGLILPTPGMRGCGDADGGFSFLPNLTPDAG
jgi:hypothetical protein